MGFGGTVPCTSRYIRGQPLLGCPRPTRLWRRIKDLRWVGRPASLGRPGVTVGKGHDRLRLPEALVQAGATQLFWGMTSWPRLGRSQLVLVLGHSAAPPVCVA